MKAADLQAAKRAFVAEVLHDLSQPLTALECGLEVSLRQDKTVTELRNRMKVLLGIAQTLHQKLLEVRSRQESTFEPVFRQRTAKRLAGMGGKSGRHS